MTTFATISKRPAGTPANAALLDANGQVSQAWREFLRNLSREQWQVGDYMQSARDDLGSGWVLCDGRAVARADYPALYSLMAAASHAFATSSAAEFSVPNVPAIYDDRNPAPGGTPVLKTWIKAR